MSLIIISPISGDPASPQSRFHEIARQREKVTLIVLGSDAEALRALEYAQARALGQAIRQVVHIPDLAILHGLGEAEVLRARWNEGALAIAMTRDFRVSSFAKRGEAIGATRVERMFATALVGTSS